MIAEVVTLLAVASSLMLALYKIFWTRIDGS